MFRSPLAEAPEFKALQENIKSNIGPLLLTGCVDSSKAFLAAELGDKERAKIIVTYNETRAFEIANDAGCFDLEAEVYPAKDLLFYQADVRGDLLIKRRMRILKRLFAREDFMIVTPVDALLESLARPEFFKEKIVSIYNGQEYPLTDLEEKLVDMGYERTSQVESAGEFSVRGGIVDVFPIAMEDPIRIEFFDDEIDTIKIFDAYTQRSIEVLDEVTFFPAKEPQSNLEDGVSLLDYLPKDALVFLDEPERLREKAEGVINEFQDSLFRRSERGEIDIATVPKLFSVDNLFTDFRHAKAIALTCIDTKCSAMKFEHSYQITASAVPTYLGHFDLLVQDLKRWCKEQASVILYGGSSSRAKRLAESLCDREIDAVNLEEEAPILRGKVIVLSGNLKRGFSYPLGRLYVLSEGDLFGREKKKKKRKYNYEGQKITELSSLSLGDYVIHENRGLGIYRGTELLDRKGIVKDYIRIEYADGALLIPVTQMDMIQKYADSSAEKVPKLNKLSGAAWENTKRAVRKAVKEVACDLVKLYSARLKDNGYQYSPDTVWQKDFEEQFAFEETEDQLRAIEETKADMESRKIMDRLICGDVGFGKTEIALRAAFKAVQDSKQVAYLVPTTILAQQHYNTFVSRLAEYGVNVELLCRFRTPKEQKKTVENIKKGTCDIVIGTHRILSSDVSFKDLGLLIIDEEQRFGVNDKEKIKSIKESVDVLSLTATPIPRTLHMSLIGARDMSLLREAPLDRMPIQTYVMEYNDEIIREAISRELARDGQVYYVHNKTSNIIDVTNRIRELVPDANVAFAHGKMREHELERIMLEFINGDIDVLVSTTIVETGLDISNVNTIIIQDSDKFGLSQLYQLRGRVGRSGRCAYAFLTYHKDKTLKDVAEKRLSAIREYSDLGSGLKIAMRDLEIRGAGNLLGGEQSGHMEAVGYELYCKMLREALEEERSIDGEKKELPEFETEIDLSIDAFIPDEYIKNPNQRIGIYKRIACIESQEELEDVQDEIIDRFGDIPLSVQNLLRVALIKKCAHDSYITKISGDRNEIEFKMYKEAPVDGERVQNLLTKHKGDLRGTFGGEATFTFSTQRSSVFDAPRLLEVTSNIIAEIGELMV